MITLITAVPGSGKTLMCIKIIEDALKEGRPVFTNIAGLVKDKFTNNQLLQDAPDDWRDTPEGSLVIYDECQQAHLYPSNAQRGVVTDERLTAMEIHRHSGHDLIFITQAPTFVHHHIRKLVGQHIHLYRGRGIGGAMRYEWSHTCDSPNDRREQERADSLFWKFPKEHFSYYQSSTVHTHKFKIPVKLSIFLVALLCFIVFVFYRLYDNSGLASLNEHTPTKAAAGLHVAAAPVTTTHNLPYDWSTNVTDSVPLGGCISSATKCQCYSKEGVTLNIPIEQCHIIISKPLPRTINISSDKRKTS